MINQDKKKYACQQCIKGHRSSHCRHTERPMIEIRNKGRPRSQCPHCSTARKRASCHTRCKCGETRADQAPSCQCKCHNGEECICARRSKSTRSAPPVTTTISPNLSRRGSSCDGPQTPFNLEGSALYDFSSQQQTGISAERSNSQKKAQNIMPYSMPQARRERSISRPSQPLRQEWSPISALAQDNLPFTTVPSPYQPLTYFGAYPIERNAASPMHMQRAIPVAPQFVAPMEFKNEAEKTFRDASTNTDPFPTHFWQDYAKMFPQDMRLYGQLQQNIQINLQQNMQQSPGQISQVVNPMPFFDFNFASINNIDPSQYNVMQNTYYPTPQAETELSLQNMSGFQQEVANMASNQLSPEEHFGNGFFDEALLTIPSCTLPGALCKCDDDCDCRGCTKHTNNSDKVTFSEFGRMDFSDGTIKATRKHPAACYGFKPKVSSNQR